MRDANWFADFPTSASKLLYFFEAGGETADGVISTTPQIFGNLLKLTGPIEMSQYGVTLTADNFQEVTQFKTSVDYDKTLNQPKKFLADFAPVLLDRLTNLDHTQWLNLFQILQDNIDQKQILLFSKNAGLETTIKNLGAGGEILETDHDYLNIINTNLGGTKTDLSVAQSASLNSKVLSDGSVLNTLTITRKNTASENNKDFIRILVPKGSQLVSATGLDSYDFHKSESEGLRTDTDLAAWDKGSMISDMFVREETGKTEFSGWVNVPSLGERKLVLTYTLPFKMKGDSTYSLLLQKQDGSKPYEFNGQLNLAEFSTGWTGNNMEVSGNTLKFESASAADDFWPMVIVK